MKKSELSKLTILHEASALFQKQGYRATSIADIENATGFTKGAIYSYFKNKEEIEIEAFDYLMGKAIGKISQKISAENDVFSKINAFNKAFYDYFSDSLFMSRCPFFNAASEFSDSNGPMKSKLSFYLDLFKNSLKKIIENGIKNKQLIDSLAVDNLVILIFTSLQGSMVISRLNQNSNDIEVVMSHIQQLLFANKHKKYNI